MNQLSLQLEPGLVERHATLLDCVNQCARGNRNPLKTIAADMDLSLSELCRKLNRDPKRAFSVDDFEAYIEATGDTTPIVYLVGKFMTDAELKRDGAIAEIARLLPQMMALVKEAGISK